MQNDAYQLYGMTMSPYSMKMRAYLRYRRIPFHWVADMRAETVARTKVETYMVPVLRFPNGQFKNDSTFLINELEELHEGRHVDPDVDRRVHPDPVDPVRVVVQDHRRSGNGREQHVYA